MEGAQRRGLKAEPCSSSRCAQEDGEDPERKAEKVAREAAVT